jgi:hypothetical protein
MPPIAYIIIVHIIGPLVPCVSFVTMCPKSSKFVRNCSFRSLINVGLIIINTKLKLNRSKELCVGYNATLIHIIAVT